MRKYTVYLIHFESKLHRAQHYIGCTYLGVEERLARHKSGNGARLLNACNVLGIEYKVVSTVDFESREEAYAFERKMKARKKARLFCPVCEELRKNKKEN